MTTRRIEEIKCYGDLLPDIIYRTYKDVYWSRHRIGDKNDLDDLKELVKNRENIAFRYKLHSNIDCPLKYDKYFIVKGNIHDLRDHTEYYKTTDKRIVCMFSTHTTDYELMCIKLRGYEQIEPIYNKAQNTFIKLVYKSFIDWLVVNYKNEDSPIGNLAKDVIEDRKNNNKYSIKTYQGLKRRMKDMNACDGALNTLDNAYDIYKTIDI